MTEFHYAVMGRVKAMIHRRGQAQRYEAPVAVLGRALRISKQIGEPVRRALDLQGHAVLHRTLRPHDRVARTDEPAFRWIDHTRAGAEVAREAVVQAAEVRRLRIGQIEIGEQPPDSDGGSADQRIFDAAEPAHESRRQSPRNAIRQEKVNILLCGNTQKRGAQVSHAQRVNGETW